MMFIIDRIEGDYAVVEFGDDFIDVPLSSFREEVKAGDVLYFVVDKEETEKRTSNARNRLFNLFNRLSDDE